MSKKGLAKEFDMTSFRDVKPAVMRAMLDAGYDSPQALWYEICDMDWNIGGREVTYPAKQKRCFVHAIHQDGRVGANGSHNYYNFWVDIIASTLEMDTDEIFGLTDEDISHAVDFGTPMAPLMEDSDGFFSRKISNKQDTIAALRSYDEDERIMHDREKTLWAMNAGVLSREYAEAATSDFGDCDVMKQKIAKTLIDVPDTQARIICLMYGLEERREFSISRIAKQLDMPIGTVRSNLSRGLERLRGYFCSKKLVHLTDHEDPEGFLQDLLAREYADAAPPQLEPDPEPDYSEATDIALTKPEPILS